MNEDFRIATVNGKQEQVISMRGVILAAYFSAKDENNQTCIRVLHRFCDYLVQQGFPGTSKSIFEQLMQKQPKETTDWIKRVFHEFVIDGAACVGYALEKKIHFIKEETT
ncbi:MAG: hypothetical protein LBJ11_08960 [Oscillospiraceae bacterium]|jgi:hypothetical protein|nr:hypothetical protein [Oscillospiraceae bacterium]